MILVTGFGPYQEELNASAELVKSLKNSLPDELLALKSRLVFEVVACEAASRETEHRALEAHLAGLLERHRPQMCIFTGQAPPYNKITIEKIAINSFMREAIDPARPAAYWSDMPGIDDLPMALNECTIPATHSFYAGQHLCNHILYSSLYLAEARSLPHKSGLIHVPVLPEQARTAHRDAPCMALEISRKALSVVIKHVLECHLHNQRRQPDDCAGG
jgi:pyroglutamyl-peptidase